MAEEKKEEKKSGFPMQMIIIILLLVVILVGGAIAVYFLFLKPPVDAEPEPPAMTSLMLRESMLVNLKDGRSFLRFTAMMEFEAENTELAIELEEKSHILQHEVLVLLRNKELAEVRPPDSIEKVQKAMTKVINARLEHGEIARIYFTEYIIQ